MKKVYQIIIWEDALGLRMNRYHIKKILIVPSKASKVFEKFPFTM
jgi:hypothetical protein